MRWDPLVPVLCVAYAVFSGVRQVLPVNAAALQADGVLTKQGYGALASSYAVAYGVAKFLGSVATDRAPADRLLQLGLAGVGACIACMAVAGPRALLIAWTAHGLCQGFGWPSTSTIIFAHVAPERRGTVWSLATAGGNAGLAIAPVLLGAVTAQWGWTTCFLATGALCIGSAIMFAFVLPATPPLHVARSKAGVDDDQDADEDDVSVDVMDDKATASPSKGQGELGRHPALSLTFWLITIPSVCCIFVSSVLTTWGLMWMQEGATLDHVTAIGCISVAQMGAIVGGLASGVVSDATGGRCLFTAALFTGACVPALLFTYWIRLPSMWTAWALFAWLGFCMSGPKTLTGIVVREHFAAAGSGGQAAGLLGLVGQVGTFAAGAPFGALLASLDQPWSHMGLVLGSAVGVMLMCYAALVGMGLLRPPDLDAKSHVT